MTEWSVPELLRTVRDLITPAVVIWTMTVSSLMALASIVITPVLLLRLPADYFLRSKPHLLERIRWGGVMHGLFLIGKNTIGVMLLIAGLLMLFLPGQGLLTILIAMVLIDFPGKASLEMRIVARPAVARSINWLRRRYGREPMVFSRDS